MAEANNNLSFERFHIRPIDEINGFKVRPGLYEQNGATAIPSDDEAIFDHHRASSCFFPPSSFDSPLSSRRRLRSCCCRKTSDGQKLRFYFAEKVSTSRIVLPKIIFFLCEKFEFSSEVLPSCLENLRIFHASLHQF